MRYEFRANYRDWELISENFEFEKLNRGDYNQDRKLSFTREAWDNNVPLYLNDYSVFNTDYIKEKAIGVVTSDPVFSIFDKENITFEEMLDAIQEKIPEIVKATVGDDNPYE